MTDTTAISYLQSNTISAGNTTEAAPSRKTITCTELSQRYVLLPVAILRVTALIARNLQISFLNFGVALLQLH